MLVNTAHITHATRTQEAEKQPEFFSTTNQNARFVAEKDILLTKSIGKLEAGKTLHFYSWSNFNLVKLILYILKQTGPAEIIMTTYSFSQKSIEALTNYRNAGLIKDIRLLIDNRVKVMSPKPFQMLSKSFDYRCTSVHAKVALIWNDNWNITIVTSQNATDNPKLERGIIFTDKNIFDFDLKNLNNEFERGGI